MIRFQLIIYSRFRIQFPNIAMTHGDSTVSHYHKECFALLLIS
jgi:hypothetical protein